MHPTLLLVDDNEEILVFLKDDLEEHYAIFTAGSGTEALEVLNTEVIQLVVSDVMMPDMDGFELCSHIKNNVEYCHIPVILLTAKNTLQAKIEGLEIGADAYVEKPFSPEFLQAQIASLLSNRNKVKAHFASSPLAHIKSMAYNKADEQFLGNLQQIIGKHLDDKMLDVEFLAKQMNMSRPTLYRKISVLSDMSPHELISLTRLKKAAELLLSGNYKVNEVADMLGFSSLANFGRSFSKQFGLSPVEYMKRNSGT